MPCPHLQGWRRVPEQPGDEENGVNYGTESAVLAVTFFNVRHGGSARIERTDPGNCPGLTAVTTPFGPGGAGHKPRSSFS